MQPLQPQPATFGCQTFGCQTYVRLDSGLQKAEEHVCTRHCNFSHVMGNMFVCATSECTWHRAPPGRV